LTEEKLGKFYIAPKILDVDEPFNYKISLIERFGKRPFAIRMHPHVYCRYLIVVFFRFCFSFNNVAID
jgi:hypothetical protein